MDEIDTMRPERNTAWCSRLATLALLEQIAPSTNKTDNFEEPSECFVKGLAQVPGLPDTQVHRQQTHPVQRRDLDVFPMPT